MANVFQNTSPNTTKIKHTSNYVPLNRAMLIGSLTLAEGLFFHIYKTHSSIKPYLEGLFAVYMNNSAEPTNVATTASGAWRSVRYMGCIDQATERSYDPWGHLSERDRKQVVSVLDILHVPFIESEEEKAA